MEGFPPTAIPAPQTVPSPDKLDGDGSSPRSIAAGEAHGFCPGSTGRTAPQPWLVPGLCMVSPSRKLTPPARSNKSVQLILGQGLAHQDSPLFGSFCLLTGFAISVPGLPSHHRAQRGNHCQILPLHHYCLLATWTGKSGDHGTQEISANGMGSLLHRLAVDSTA